MPFKILKCQNFCCIASMRHVIGILLMLGVIVLNMQRSVFLSSFIEIVSSNNKYDWDDEVQFILLTGIHIGYVPTSVLAGWLSDKFGGRFPLLLASSISALICFLTPIIIMYTNWKVVLVLRIIHGSTQAFLIPCVTSMLSRWIPPSEISSFCGAIFSANSISTIIGFAISTLLKNYFQSWVPSFILIGFLTIFYCITFFFYVYSSAEHHPHLTPEELIYIKTYIGEKFNAHFHHMIKDTCIYGLIGAQLSHAFFIANIKKHLPKYMKMKQNSFVSSLPLLLIFVSSLLSGIIADWLITKKNLRIEFIRRLYTMAGVMLPVAFIFLAAVTNIVIFLFGLFFNGPFYAGFYSNCLDVTKNHPGILIGFINLFNALPEISTIFYTGLFYEDFLKIWKRNNHHRLYLTGVIMGLVFLISCAGFLAYCYYSTSTRRVWDYFKEEEAPTETRNQDIPWYNEKTIHDFKVQKIKAIEHKKAYKDAKKARLNARD